jgi:predicted ATPase/class 3 adenylate cyclase
MTSILPSGTVTFLYTDIEGSTQLWQHNPTAMKGALADHDAILKDAIASNHGFVVKPTGDGVHAVFSTALDGIRAAIAAQRSLQLPSDIPDSSGDLHLRVRMGLHTGEAELRDDDYFGGTLNRAARIMSIGYGDQILVSEATLQVALDRLPQGVSVLDLGYHDLKGLSRAEHVYQLNVPGLRAEFPPLKSLSHPPDNLPAQLTSFIGRERELAEAKSRLEGARLLTLIGPGGTGKTRLSIQLGSQLLPAFKDGVWLVELAPISDPSLIMQTIASAFEIGELPGVPLKDLVHDYLREKQLLLLLDNCEHLVEASASLADELLHIAPAIKIIASSREALSIYGEVVYRVPSLSLPEQAVASRDAALGFEAVQLFVERASAANPGFTLTDENAPAIAQICTRLDGIPLAIELAASRITVFSPAQIAKRLDDRFKLLTGGSRTALPRQQTLRALIDWSYDFLTDEERSLLRRLSVFAGGWTFEAAETICSNVDVFENLPQLVNKSLVNVKLEGDEPRYFMLETIRQYAREKLSENGEGEGTRNRHFAYYLELAETAMPELLTWEKELYWIRKLDTESDNLRVAVEWGLSNDPIAVMRMIRSLRYDIILTNYSSEGHRWGAEALERVRSLTDNGRVLTAEENLHRARLIATMSMLSLSMGNIRATVIESDEAVSLLRSLGDKEALVIALAHNVEGKLMSGKVDEAIKSVDEALRLAEELGDNYLLGSALSSASNLETIINKDFVKADALREKACELLKGHSNRWSYGITMYGFGNILMIQKQFERAREKYEIAMQSMLEVGSKRNVNMIESDLAHILRYEGRYPEAIRAYHETILEWQRLGHRAAVAHQLECLAFIAKALEQVDKAIRLLGAAEALRQRIGNAMTPRERDEYDAEVAGLKANTNEVEFVSRWAEGCSMTMDEAIDLALDI